MSLVGRFPSTCLASLFVFALGLNEWAEPAAAAEGRPSAKAAVLETFTKPDGQAYFALKLSPQVSQPANRPHDVVILFDTSASQVGPYRVKGLGVLRSLLASLSPDDRVALLAVDLNAVRLTESLVAPSGGAVNQALAALERRVPLGSTDMQEALDSALAVYQNAEAGRARSVVYIGDGVSTASFLPLGTIRRIVGQYTQQRVNFSSYAIGPRLNGALLAALANHTGGMLVSDEANVGEKQVGSDLAAILRGAVIWPVAVHMPPAMTDVYPRQAPPLRLDRDSVLVGSIDPQAIEAGQPLAVEIEAELAGKPTKLSWNVVPEKSLAENGYLAKVVEVAAQTDGVALPTVGSAGLSELRRWVTYGAQQLAAMGERAMAVGHADDAAQLAREAERLDPDNAAAATVRAAAMRARQPAAGDLRLARAPTKDEPSISAEGDAAEAADGELLDEVERQQRVVQGFLRVEVNNALNQASAAMGVDPEGTRDWLKLLLDKVQHTAELAPEVRAQLVDKIEAALRLASRKLVQKTEQDLQRQQIAAEGEARERINRELFLQEQKVDQLMARFGALMDEERYRDAEALADIAEEIEPGRPGLRGAELTARMVGYQADTFAVLDMRRKGFVDACFQIELSHVPTADEPPILYPDPEVWQLLTERRKKYKAVDLTQHGPNEAKILAALDEKTELDFADQPLEDVVEYLQQRHEINIQLDGKALSDAGVGSDTPITRSIKGITLRSALKLLLSELDLTYVIRNEVLMITSKTEAENLLSTRVYPVADLVIPVPSAAMGRGMFNVRDDEAGRSTSTIGAVSTNDGVPTNNVAPVVGSGGLRAFAVKDDLKLSKKGPKSPEADEAKAASPARIGKAAAAAKVPPAGKERGIQRDEPAVEQPRPQQQARGRREKIEPIR
ncbi:MAG TPA: VWA domain-containing protein, partial [Pirellulales bacterium]|nr:VWA domain-containing protein [Pirellulales bacterium]